MAENPDTVSAPCESTVSPPADTPVSPFLDRFVMSIETDRVDFFIGFRFVLIVGLVIIFCLTGFCLATFVPIGIRLGFYWINVLGWLGCLALLFILFLSLIFVTLADGSIERMARIAYAKLTETGTAIPSLLYDLSEDEERIVLNDSLFNFLIGQPGVHSKFNTSYFERLKLLATKMSPRKARALRRLGSGFSDYTARLTFLSPLQPMGKWWRFNIPCWQVYLVVLCTELAVKLLIIVFFLMLLNVLWLGFPYIEVLAVPTAIAWAVRSTSKRMAAFQMIAFQSAFFRLLSDIWPWEYERLARERLSRMEKGKLPPPGPFDIGSRARG